jgi:hypothetical protein
MTAEVAPEKNLNLEARGFGWLIDPAPAHGEIQVGGPLAPFSYFTYKIAPRPGREQRTIWSTLPIDGAWGYFQPNGPELAGPCLTHSREDSEAPVCPELLRHWCPVLFDETLINK